MKLFSRTLFCTVLLAMMTVVFGCKPTVAPAPPKEEVEKGMEKYKKPAPPQ